MSSIVVRPLEGADEYAECVALQRRTWGERFSELVPASMLMVAQKMGGIASGAFDGDRLAGMVFGISGVHDGRPGHWSDMLAVDPAYRGRGIGRLLKLHQRERLLEIGIERVLWTFDPLEARNAHLNLSRLGAIARTYTRDAYGASDSPLHAGIGTDRLLAEWDLRSPRVVRRLEAPPDVRPGPASREPGQDADEDDAPFLATPRPAADGYPHPGSADAAPGAPRVRLAIPSDIQGLKGAEPELARAWRLHVREALERCFERGYAAVGLRRIGGGLAAYALWRDF